MRLENENEDETETVTKRMGWKKLGAPQGTKSQLEYQYVGVEGSQGLVLWVIHNYLSTGGGVRWLMGTPRVV